MAAPAPSLSANDQAVVAARLILANVQRTHAAPPPSRRMPPHYNPMRPLPKGPTVGNPTKAVDHVRGDWRQDFASAFTTVMSKGMRSTPAKTLMEEPAPALRGLPPDMGLETAMQRRLHQLPMRTKASQNARTYTYWPQQYPTRIGWQ